MELHQCVLQLVLCAHLQWLLPLKKIRSGQNEKMKSEKRVEIKIKSNISRNKIMKKKKLFFPSSQ